MTRAARSSVSLTLALGACLLGISVLAYVVSGSRAATARTLEPDAEGAREIDSAFDPLASLTSSSREEASSEQPSNPPRVALDASPADTADTTGIAADETSVLRGVVHDRLGRPVPGVRLALRAAFDGGRGVGPVPEDIELEALDGTFHFEAPAGVYHLTVTGFPDGSDWLAPWGQGRAAFAPDDARAVAGRFARRIELAATERTSVELLVVRAAAVEGRVVGPDGQPVERARVRLVSPEIEGFARDATTDAEGRYRFERLHPGALLALVDLRLVRDDDLRTCLPPQPHAVLVEEGRAHDLEPLRLRAGELVGVATRPRSGLSR